MKVFRIPFLLPVFFSIACLVFVSCGGSNPEKPKTGDTQASDTAHFYPLDVYFKEQTDYVALHGFPIYRIMVKDGKKDSAAISTDAFIAIAQTLHRYDISAPDVKALYRETSFEDLSTASLTLNYKPVDKSAIVQNIDILMDQEGRAVKRVFIRAVQQKGDTTITEQYSWKTNKSLQVNRSLEAKNYSSTELNFINWNDRP